MDIRRFGPSGGTGGTYFTTAEDKRIRTINFSYGANIDRITIEFTDGSREDHGGGGQPRWAAHPSRRRVDHRHHRQERLGRGQHPHYHEPAGRGVRGAGGHQEFIYSGAPHHELVGFFGYKGSRIDALGVIFRGDLHPH